MDPNKFSGIGLIVTEKMQAETLTTIPIIRMIQWKKNSPSIK